MRYLEGHVVEKTTAGALRIAVVDEPGSGGANHAYVIHGYRQERNPSLERVQDYLDANDIDRTNILFQNGPIPHAGVNGVTHEALLAVLIDRLQGFQGGEFACKENAEAMSCLEEAMMILHARTLARMARGVEGKEVK
jgi:hypothetical protein